MFSLALKTEYCSVDAGHRYDICVLPDIDTLLSVDCHDTFKKSQFLMEMVSPNVDPPSSWSLTFDECVIRSREQY